MSTTVTERSRSAGYAYAYFSQEMITYEFDRRYTANAAQYYYLHSVS
ncbi:MULTISPECIES: hypothetical protein [unclassified Nostoc]|nr:MULTISPECIES: hypothetical protein [unclassified Nostoc]